MSCVSCSVVKDDRARLRGVGVIPFFYSKYPEKGDRALSKEDKQQRPHRRKPLIQQADDNIHKPVGKKGGQSLRNSKLKPALKAYRKGVIHLYEKEIEHQKDRGHGHVALVLVGPCNDIVVVHDPAKGKNTCNGKEIY